MASTYSTNLAIELIGTGEQSGTWGTTTNTNLGTLLEQAISGYVTQAITDGSGANTTITIPNGATGVARNMTIEMTGALTFSTTSLIVPANKKMYFIFNNTTGGFAVTVKVSGQTGILVPNGKKVVLTSNGTDIVEAHTAIVGNATMGGTLGITGTTTAAAINASGLVAMAGAATVGTTLAVTGTSTMAAINASGLVAMAGAATVGTTLGVTGTTTAAAINASGVVTVSKTTVGVAMYAVTTNTTGLNAFVLQDAHAGITHAGVVGVASDAANKWFLGYASSPASTLGTVALTWDNTQAVSIPGTLAVTGATTLAGLTSTNNVTNHRVVFRNTATANTANDVGLEFYAKDSGAADQLYGFMVFNSSTITAGAEQTTFTLGTTTGGANVNLITAVGQAVSIPGTLALGSSGMTVTGSASAWGFGVAPPTIQTGYKAINIGATVGGGIISAGTDTYFTNNATVDGGTWKFGGTGYASYYNQTSGIHTWTASSASGTAGNAATMNTLMTLSVAGKLTISGTQSQGQDVLASVSSSAVDWLFSVATGTAGHGSAAALHINANTNGRSINAGGTVNASGADYAEYERKASLSMAFAKGDIIGYNAEGQLTTQERAVSFGVKSTNPNFVGGDTWGSELGSRPYRFVTKEGEEGYESESDFAQRLKTYEDALDVERQWVDRVAYCGKTPVNVTGATPGEFIVADNGGEVWDLTADATVPDWFKKYLRTVGRVRRVLPDGRAEIAVYVH